MAHVFYLKDRRNGTPATLDANLYEYVGKVEHNDLEDVFRAMNAVDGSPIEKCDEFQCRSMSTGDIAVLQDGPWICESVGWKHAGTAHAPEALGEFVVALSKLVPKNVTVH